MTGVNRPAKKIFDIFVIDVIIVNSVNDNNIVN